MLSAAPGTLKRPATDILDANPAKTMMLDGGAPIATLGVMPQMANTEQTLTEIVEVPDTSVGLIIGRKGEQIANIQAQSGCKVQMSQDGVGNPSRECTLTGNPPAIQRARALINEIVERSANRPPPGSGLNGASGMGDGVHGGITIQLMIPGNKVGLVIGKSGETIKQLQERSGVSMKMIQDTTSAGDSAKPMRLQGDPSKIDYAKQLIQEIINSRPDGEANNPMRMGGGFGGGQGQGGMGMGGGMGPKSVGEVIVPRSSVGMIIGKGGDMIKKIGQDTGAKIQFKNDEQQEAPERTAVLSGTVDQIQRATQMITELVHRSMTDGRQETFYMHVPANKTGLVIGRGGETIKALNAECGGHIELSRDPQPNPNEKVFVIKGTPYQIHMAQHQIRVKVGDLPIGSPMPPFSAGGVQVSNQGGAGGGPGVGAPGQGGPPQMHAQMHPGFGGGPPGGFGAPSGFGGAPQMVPPFQPQQQWPPQQPQQHAPPHFQQPQGGAPFGLPPQQQPQVIQPQQHPPQQAPPVDTSAWMQQQMYGGQPAQQAPAPQAQVVQPQAVIPQQQQYMPQQQPQASVGYAPTNQFGAQQPAQQQQPQPQQPPQQQVQPQPQAAAPQPAAQPQAQAAANGGQADYSAQWIEYYRAQGMHDQAAQIEQQARQAQQQQRAAPVAPAQQPQAAPVAQQSYQPFAAVGQPQPQQPLAQPMGAMPATSVYGGYPQAVAPQVPAAAPQQQYAYQPQY
jgi:far upstream element-binding protein